MQPGLKTLLALTLALGLAACGRPGPDAGTGSGSAPGGEPAQSGLATDAIEVTPLDGPPTGTAATGAASSAATPDTPASTAPAGAEPATAAPPTASEPPAIPVQQAKADTPHPRPRPADGAGAAADGTEDATPDAAAPPPEPPKSQSQLLCEASGGVWGQMPDNGAYLCQKKTRDGGKQCRAKGDCQGECLAPSGTCAPVMPLLGCNDILDDQGRRMTLCLD